MRLIASVWICIFNLTVEGSTGFRQCLGKKPRKLEVDIFNWPDDRLVADRTRQGMSALYVPAIPTLSDEGSSRVYENKMIIDTGNSKSRFHPKDCKASSSVQVEITLGADKVFLVSASTDCEKLYLSGQVGVGPKSELMKSVGKLELTIRGRKYTKLRSGKDVETRGYTFSDIIKHHRYPEAWAIVGAIRHENTEENRLKKVNIIFRTLSSPENMRPDTSLYTVYIPLVAQQTVPLEVRPGVLLPRTKQETFSLQGDQFFYMDYETIVVNPIVLGYTKDIRIVFDSTNFERPRMAIKALPKQI